MKTKLTVTIDSELVPRAKRYARAQGVSLSALIEDALRDMTTGERESFASRWRGKFEVVPEDDPRFQYLAEKYLNC